MDQSQLGGLCFFIAFVCGMVCWQLHLKAQEEKYYKDGDEDDNDDDR